MNGFIYRTVVLFVAACLCFPSNTMAAQKMPKLRVACIGDSITYGLKVDEYAKYPTVLGDLLGPDYEVKNFGVSNSSVSDNAFLPYKTTKEYTESIAYDPDIVIIMLGTNDAKGVNWNTKESFSEDYAELVDSYPEASVITATPPKAFCVPLGEEWTDPAKVTEIAGIIREIAERRHTIVADINCLSMKTWIREDDGIHMTNSGSVSLAVAIKQAVSKVAAG